MQDLQAGGQELLAGWRSAGHGAAQRGQWPHELVFDLGPHGERRQDVEVVASTTTDVRITLP
ncbi:MAG TPA: hypothetical protein VF384_14175 [Planctomycetota bacterium]